METSRQLPDIEPIINWLQARPSVRERSLTTLGIPQVEISDAVFGEPEKLIHLVQEIVEEAKRESAMAQGPRP